jgi:hypothetical protein
MSSGFEWKPDTALLDQVIDLAQQQGRSPNSLVTEAVSDYLQNHPLLNNSFETNALSLQQRRAFMKLPLQERRHILQQQAEAMMGHYQQSEEWRDLQAGDLIDY